jgi:N-acetylmuramoyl-L-alanine amidase
MFFVLMMAFVIASNVSIASDVTDERIQYELKEGERLNNAIILADVMWCEAVSEGRVGMLAIADVVLNRVEDKRYPNTIEEVVHQPWQFECITKGRRGNINDYTYREALKLAMDVLDGKTPRITFATHYYSYVIMADNPPKWSNPKKRLGKIGNHVFYKL